MPSASWTPEAGDGPLIELEWNSKYDTTFFPNDLVDTPYFILFRAKKEYKFSELANAKSPFSDQEGTGRFGSIVNDVFSGIQAVGGFFKALENIGIDITQPAHAFALPIPSNLSTSYNSQYSTTPLGLSGAAGRTVGQAMGGQDTGSFTGDLLASLEQTEALSGESIKSMMQGLAVKVAGADTFASAFAGFIAGGGIGTAGLAAALGGAATGLLQGLGIAANPHIANVFTGVDFRRHTFSYKLIPKNKKESDTLRDLIRNFKYHMAPDYRADGHVFLYPSKFQIILRAGDYLFKIGDSVLTSFDVNYTGEGAPYFFEDTNAPYSVTLNLTFVEDTIVTKKEIRQGR